MTPEELEVLELAKNVVDMCKDFSMELPLEKQNQIDNIFVYFNEMYDEVVGCQDMSAKDWAKDNS